jgi:SAM-dependent methyltransferase
MLTTCQPQTVLLGCSIRTSVTRDQAELYWTDYAGLALASAVVLALQVTATRLFSFLIWYHFAFLVIAIGFLGFTAGGLLVGGRVGAGQGGLVRATLARLGFASGFAIVFAFGVLSHLPLEPDFQSSVSGLSLFLVAVLAMLVPFVCLGAYVCLALSAWPGKIGTLYGANLGGSALGCAAVVLALDALGVTSAFIAVGFLGFLAGMVSYRPARRAAWMGVALIACAWLGLIHKATDELDPLVYVKSAKAYPHLPREQVLARKSDSLSSVEMFKGSPKTLWGLSKLFKGTPPELISFAIDGWALTSVFNRAQADVPNGVLDYLPAGLPYLLKPPGDVLVIGAGGGVDVLTALHHGAKHVVGVEINPIILDAVRTRYADFAGHLYDDPRVEMHHAEGRHFLKRDGRKFDVIQLSGVDTFAASQAGAFALHENYLYTVEAMHDYLAALRPAGLLTFTRWLYIPPRQTVRLVAIAEQAFRERGVSNPAEHMAIFAKDAYSVVLIKNEAFSHEEIDRLKREVEGHGFDLVYAPFNRVNPYPELWGENQFYRFWDLGPARFIDSYPLDVRPTTDDLPFFFEYQRWSSVLAWDLIFHNQNAGVVLFATLVVCSVLCLLLLMAARRRYRGAARGLGLDMHLYFSVLGLGYILVENVLIQRIILFLGTPAYALTVILFTLLAASGLGSSVAGRSAALRRYAAYALVAVVVLLLGYAYGLRPVLDGLLGLALPLRVLIVVLLIAPLGFLMGMPFPLAIERLSDIDPRLVPWAWVINGSASVIGSIITIMLAMTRGFTSVFWVAALLYTLAAWLYARSFRASLVRK